MNLLFVHGWATPRRKVAIISCFLVFLVIAGGAYAAQQQAFLQMNFRVLTTPYNIWFHVYGYPTSTSDCQWIVQRALIVYAERQQDVQCFKTYNPNIKTIIYQGTGAYTYEQIYQALNNTESAWLHWTDGRRAYFTYNSLKRYVPNPASPDVLSWFRVNDVPLWKSIGVDGVFQDEFGVVYGSATQVLLDDPTGVNSVVREFSSYSSWIQAYASFWNIIKKSMGKPFIVVPNALIGQAAYNVTAWLSGYNGVLDEFYPRSLTAGDDIVGDMNLQRAFAAVNSSAILEYLPTAVPSLYWLAAYYLCSRVNGVLYTSVPFQYPVPKGFILEGWDPKVWDKLNLGAPLADVTILHPTGDSTVSVYIRHYQKGVVVALRHSTANDARTFNISLNGSYYDLKTNSLVANVTLGVDGAFIGTTYQQSQVYPAAISPFLAIPATLVLAFYSLIKGKNTSRKKPA